MIIFLLLQFEFILININIFLSCDLLVLNLNKINN